jgi:serine phosphatase RsbU (regulator of sigma subunit)
LHEALRHFQQGAPQDDDVTVVAIHRQGAEGFQENR